MHDFIFGICGYNDPSVIRLLDSLPGDVPKLYVDGKFLWNESGPELTSPELREKIQSYPNVTIIDAPNLLEPDKREKYLNVDAKAVFIIDTDEWIHWADWQLFREELKQLTYGIHLIEFVENGAYFADYPRIWVNPKDWHYVQCHNIFENRKTGERLRSSGASGYRFKSVQCSMNDHLRSEEYVKSTFDYQKKLIAYEKPLKKQLL